MAKQNKKEKKYSWYPVLIPMFALILLLVGSWLIQTRPELFMLVEQTADKTSCCIVTGFGDLEKVSGGLIVIYKTDCGEIIRKETSVIREVGDVVCRQS